MGNSDSNDLRPQHDWQKVVLFVLACAGAVYSFGDKIFSIGKTNVSAEKVDHLEAVTNQLTVDMARTQMQAASANAASLRVEDKQDKMDSKVDHINDVLTQIRITGRR